MILKYMGKMLYPRLHPSQRLHEVKMLLLASAIGVFFAAIIVVAIVSRDWVHR